MISKGKSLAERMNRWLVLIGSAQGNLEGMPLVAEDVRELERIAKEANELAVEIAALRARTQEATSSLRKLATQGDRVRGRIAASLRGKYGFTSEVLISFGLKPRPRSRRVAALREAAEFEAARRRQLARSEEPGLPPGER